MQLTDEGKKALRNALGAANDNLARANLQMRNSPSWKSGNGITIQDIVASYERCITDLAADLRSHD